MKTAEDILRRANSILPDFREGDEKAKAEMEALSWLSEVPLDFITAALAFHDDCAADPAEICRLKKEISDLNETVEDLKEELELEKILSGQQSEEADNVRVREEAAAAEIKKMQDRIDSLLHTKDELSSRLQKQEATLAVFEQMKQKKAENQKLNRPVLYDGTEREFFDNEKQEILVSVLEEALKGIKPGTRRYDVVNDIIIKNRSAVTPEGRTEKITDILKNNDTPSKKVLSDLARCGIMSSSGGKHIKLTYYNDPRYMVSLSASPSDSNAYKNAASEISKIMF